MTYSAKSSEAPPEVGILAWEKKRGSSVDQSLHLKMAAKAVHFTVFGDAIFWCVCQSSSHTHIITQLVLVDM